MRVFSYYIVNYANRYIIDSLPFSRSIARKMTVLQGGWVGVELLSGNKYGEVMLVF
jgi:hypothetical protein